jgi:DNA-binding MarR family transcriptional regulator
MTTTTTASPYESRGARLGRVAHLNVLIAADRFRDALEERAKAEGITMAQYAALWVLCLSDAPDGVTTGAIADGLITRQPDVTRLVDRLVKAGLAERRPSPADRRVVLVAPTKKGRAIFTRLTPQIAEYHLQQWSNLTQAELRTLHELLGKALWGES